MGVLEAQKRKADKEKEKAEQNAEAEQADGTDDTPAAEAAAA
jgi:hypothetical protein